MALKHHREKSHGMSNLVVIFWLGGGGVRFFAVVLWGFFNLFLVLCEQKKCLYHNDWHSKE